MSFLILLILPFSNLVVDRLIMYFNFIHDFTLFVQTMTEVSRADATVAVATAQPVPPSVLCRTSCPVSAVTVVQPLTEVLRATTYGVASSI